MSNFELPNLSEIRHEAAQRRAATFREAIKNKIVSVLEHNTKRVVNAVVNNEDVIVVPIVQGNKDCEEWMSALRKQRATCLVLPDKESQVESKARAIPLESKVTVDGHEDVVKFRLCRVRLTDAGRTPIRPTKPASVPSVLNGRKLVK